MPTLYWLSDSAARTPLPSSRNRGASRTWRGSAEAATQPSALMSSCQATVPCRL